MATRVIIMAGGTGGHVFPALAVARELVARGCQVSWLGAPDSFESRTVPAAGFTLDTVSAFRLRGQGLSSLLLAPARLLRAVWQAWQILRRRRPQVLVGMGGFVTGPGGIAAFLQRLPLVVHEQNAIPGLANRWLARVATRVLEAFAGSFPGSFGAVATGNPVRSEIAELPAPERKDKAAAARLLVLGGSLGAQALNERLPQAVALLDPNLKPVIRHQAGRGKGEATQALYRDCGFDAEVTEFIDDMAGAYRWADLVVCRAGALTVSELSAAGVGAILVPYPHAVDDHQTANARFLESAGAARLVDQSVLDPERLAALLTELLADREQLHAMAVRAYAVAQRDATRHVADVIEEVAR